MGYSYLSLTEILTSGTKVPNYCTRYILWDAVTYLYLRYSRLAPRSPITVHVIFCGMQLLISNWDTHVWHQSPQLLYTLYSVGCSYLSLTEILTSGTKVPNYCTRYILWDAVTYLYLRYSRLAPRSPIIVHVIFCGMQLLISNWDTHVWHQSPQLLYTLFAHSRDSTTFGNALRWRHNGRDGVSNHRRLGCLLNHLFMRRSKKTSKLRVTGLCEGNSPVTGEFPAQKPLKASNAENVSIWWRHHRRQTVFATRNLTKQLTKCVIKVQPTTWTRHIVTENMTAMGKVDIFMWHSIWWWMIIPFTISSCVPPNLLHKTPL